MDRLIKDYNDGSKLIFSQGHFDKWCVVYSKKDAPDEWVRDIDYFENLRKFAAEDGAEKVYQDFLDIYNHTGKDVEQDVLSKIDGIAKTYTSDELEVNKTFVMIYGGMIAEENKENTKLGKRIKRLGIHKLIKENVSVEEAANFMRGLVWRDIDKMCSDRGF